MRLARHTPGMSTTPHQSFVLQGLGLNVGPHPWLYPRFPTRDERAALVAHCLPAWAIASGSTAAWVWTGMGLAEPWVVLRREHPGLSPLERTQWSAKLLNPAHHTLRTLSGLVLLDPDSTAMEVLLSPHSRDIATAQLFVLEPLCGQDFPRLASRKRASQQARKNAGLTLQQLATLREVYPDITR